MTQIYELKDKITKFHAEYEIYLAYLYKFLIAFVLFCVINAKVGFMERIAELPVSLILALVCCLLPQGVTLLVAAVLVVVHLSVLSLEVAIAAILIFVLIFFVYFRFSPKDGLIVAITPILHTIGIPYLATIGTGLLRNVYSVAAVVCGTIAFYFVDGIYQNVVALQMTAAGAEIDASKVTVSVEQLLSNKEMYLTVGVFIVAAIAVYLVRKLNMDHAWKVAILVGTLVQVAGLLTGYLVLDIQGRWIPMIIGSLISGILALGIEFIFMDLDYTRTERVQFEDDEYYYYVKAVPKRSVTVTEKNITQFADFPHLGKKKKPETVVRKKDIVQELGIDEDDLK
ncbi:MAG: hypothetical protein IJO60_12255 [Agathobacter sp.]|nr:hypothetical protein [Agathobacter sp.]